MAFRKAEEKAVIYCSQRWVWLKAYMAFGTTGMIPSRKNVFSLLYMTPRGSTGN